MQPWENVQRRNSIEQAKAELTEDQRQNLLILKQEIAALWESLNSGEKDSIKTIYGYILKEQSNAHPILRDINDYKEQLIKAYKPHYDILKQLLKDALPQGLIDYLAVNKISLRDFAKNISDELKTFQTQELTKETIENKFRLAVWIDKIQKIKFSLDKLV